MGFLETLAISSITKWAVGIVASWFVAFIFKQIPNNKIKAVVGKFFYGLGVSMTLGLSKWKLTKGFWNSTIEPWFVDFISNVFGEAINQFILGLRSDNDPE
jgi:hypothetical protein